MNNNYWCDLGSMPIWGNQIQCYRIREHYKYPKGTQNTVAVYDAYNYSPKYVYKSESTNTSEEAYKCGCININNNEVYRPKTWKSVVNLYGDEDTTEVWDDYTEAPIATLNSKQQYSRDRYFEANTAIKKPNLKTKDKNKDTEQKTKLNQYSEKKYINSVPETNENLEVYIKKGSKGNPQTKSQQPKIFNFKFEKKPKQREYKDSIEYQSGDFCNPSECKEIIKKLYNPYVSLVSVHEQKNKGKPKENFVSNIKENKAEPVINNEKQKKIKLLCQCKVESPKNETKTNFHFHRQGYQSGDFNKLNENAKKNKGKHEKKLFSNIEKNTAKTIKNSEKQKQNESVCQCKVESPKNEKKTFQVVSDRKGYQSGDFSAPNESIQKNKVFKKKHQKELVSNIENITVEAIKNRKYLKKNELLCQCKVESPKNEKKTNFHIVSDRKGYQSDNFSTPNESVQISKKSQKSKIGPSTTIKDFENEEQFNNKIFCTCKFHKTNGNIEGTVIKENIYKNVINGVHKNNKKYIKNKIFCRCKSINLFKENHLSKKENQVKSGEIEEKTKGKIKDNELCTCKCPKHIQNVNKNETIHQKPIQYNCNLFLKLFHFRSNKKDSMKIIKETFQKPLFDIQVDANNLHVINSLEINNKIKHLGKTKNVDYCVCKSRYNRNKSQICKYGICEKARKKNNIKFDCYCDHNKENVECNDSTCDQTNIFRKNISTKLKRNNISKNPKNIKPLFDVILDKSNMDIVNSEEIVDIFRKASDKKLCRHGVCRIASRKNIESNCKCIVKKMPKTINECSNDACKISLFDSNLCNYCSKIFSKSDNWNHNFQNLKRRRRDIGRMVTRSDMIHKRQSLNINVSKKGMKKKRKKSKIKQPLKVRCRQCLERLTNAKERERLRREKMLARMTPEERAQYYNEEKEHSCKEKVKEKEEIYKEQDKKALQALEKRLDELLRERQRDGYHSTFLNDIIAGPLNVTIRIIKQLFISTYYVIVDPIGSYVYIKEKIKNPIPTIQRIHKWLIRTWHSKTVFLSSICKNSRALNIISDQIEDHPMFETLIASRISAKERARFERKAVLRKKRIQMRRDEALFGCRHILLTTMRKTPCLWIYSICPNFYPQCLSLIDFWKNFINIIIYIIALACWTPCILSVELCRALLCCIVCTH